MPQSLTKFVTARVQLLETVFQLCGSQDLQKKRSMELYGAIEAHMMAKPKLELDEVNEVNAIIQASRFQADQKSRLVELASSKCTPVKPVTAAGAEPGSIVAGAEPEYPKHQVHCYIENYLTEEDWNIMKDQNLPKSTRVMPLAKAMQRCGWFLASEPALATVAGTMGGVGLDVTGEGGLTVLNDLKTHLNTIKKNAWG